jgi:dynamin 1-like protein
VRKQIERLFVPSLDCLELVFHELQRLALQFQLLSSELIRFPHLRTRLLQVFQRLLKSCVEPTKAHIERIVQCELAYINSAHSNFIGGSAAVTS